MNIPEGGEADRNKDYINPIDLCNKLNQVSLPSKLDLAKDEADSIPVCPT